MRHLSDDPLPDIEEYLHTGPHKRRWLLIISLILAVSVLIGLRWYDTDVPRATIRDSIQQAIETRWYQTLNTIKGPVRVGIQVGHLNSLDHPEELAELRWSTGGHAQGVDEVDINLRVANALAERLEARGIVVDIIPATPTPNYKADVFVAIHADSSPDPERQGYKSSVYKDTRNRHDQRLKELIDKAYFDASGMADDDANVTASMLLYYAFNRHYKHSVSRSTPGIIVELGYISNRRNLIYMQNEQQPASALESGIIAFLKERKRLLD